MDALLEDLQQALRAARNIMASDSRDWTRRESDSFLYGILVGWSKESLEDLRLKFRWGDVTIDQIQGLRRAIWRIQATKLPVLDGLMTGLKVPEDEEEAAERKARGVAENVELAMHLIAAITGEEVIEGQNATLRDSVVEVALSERREILREIRRLQKKILREAPDDGSTQAVAACAAVAELDDLKSKIRNRPAP